MTNVINLNPPQPEAGFLVCPSCQSEDSAFFPVCRNSPQGPFIIALVCDECEVETPVEGGYLMAPVTEH